GIRAAAPRDRYRIILTGRQRPAHLRLDRAHGLLDAIRRRGCLLALERDDLPLRLLVGKKELCQSTQDEHATHQQHEDCQVLPEEGCAESHASHRYTVLARKSSLAAIGTPSRFARFRLS